MRVIVIRERQRDTGVPRRGATSVTVSSIGAIILDEVFLTASTWNNQSFDIQVGSFSSAAQLHPRLLRCQRQATQAADTQHGAMHFRNFKVKRCHAALQVPLAAVSLE